jgi:glycosyltransferase involved in cell wall biosynthesis
VGVYAESLLTFRGDMLRSMVDQGHQVLAMAPQDDPRVRAAFHAMGVTFTTIPLRRTGLNPLHDGRFVFALVRIFRGFRPDAVLAYAAKPVVYGMIAGRLARVPLRAAMITGVGSALGGGSSLRRRALAIVLRGLYSIALRQAHVILFQNPDDERRFRALGLIRKHHRLVRIQGSGVDLDRFSPAPLPDGPITFLMLSRLLRDKGVMEYAEAARRVRRLRPDARIQLLGDYDPNPSAVSSEVVESWRTDGALEYLGSTADVRPFLAAAHVCVLPSYGEGMPHSVLEAMAMGRAILTTDVPGCRETVTAGRNGCLVPPRDAGALTDAMLAMIDDPLRLATMGRESRAMAEERFDVHDVNRTILDAMGLSGSGDAA